MKYLNCKQAARHLGLKESRVRTAVFRKEIPFIKVGRLVRFRKIDLDKWMGEQVNEQVNENDAQLKMDIQKKEELEKIQAQRKEARAKIEQIKSDLSYITGTLRVLNALKNELESDLKGVKWP